MDYSDIKILWKGNVFNPTGMATVNRETIIALLKFGCKIQCTDPWHNKWEFNEGLSHLNKAINVYDKDKNVITIFADYPQYWREGHGRLIGHFVHEGTKLFPDWPNQLNQVEHLYVPSEATKNLFKWNGVNVPMTIIPHGTKPELYKPKKYEKEVDDFIFLSVNSWAGYEGDRKGTDLLIKAFDKEFKKDEKVKLILKIGTFWQGKTDYMSSIINILGHYNENILFNDAYVPEKELAKYYQKSDCFVSPTRGEAFGLTILNAMACGLPVIVTDDVNSGHMDYCKFKKSVLWIDAPTVIQGDPRFYVEGNMLAEPDLESLRKQMRYAFENRDKLKKKALEVSKEIRKEYTWENTAKKILKIIENG